VNFDLPLSPEDYIHHVGRTGRAGQPGMAVSLVSKDSQEVQIGGPHQKAVLWEEDFLVEVEKLIGGRVERRKVPGPWKDVDWHELDDALAEGPSGSERQEGTGAKPQGRQSVRGRRERSKALQRGVRQSPRSLDKSSKRGSSRDSRSEAAASQSQAESAVPGWKEGKQGPTRGAGSSDSSAKQPVKVQDVVEGMERGLAERAGIKRLTDIEKEPRAKRKGSLRTRKAAVQGG
jgi:superfamily II DNA/RNA helicase